MRFDELNLEDAILDGLEAMNFQEATPVQEQTIPVILAKKDIIACAQTGTGKTAAYVGIVAKYFESLQLIDC